MLSACASHLPIAAADPAVIGLGPGAEALGFPERGGGGNSEASLSARHLGAHVSEPSLATCVASGQTRLAVVSKAEMSMNACACGYGGHGQVLLLVWPSPPWPWKMTQGMCQRAFGTTIGASECVGTRAARAVLRTGERLTPPRVGETRPTTRPTLDFSGPTQWDPTHVNAQK